MSACIYDMDIYVGKERMHDCRCDSDSVSVRYLRRMLVGYGHKLCIDNFFFFTDFFDNLTNRKFAGWCYSTYCQGIINGNEVTLYMGLDMNWQQWSGERNEMYT